MSDNAEIADAVKQVAADAQQQSSAFMGQVKSFASGGVGGICAVLVGMCSNLLSKLVIVHEM